MAYTSVKMTADTSSYQAQMKSAAAQMKMLSAEYQTAATKAKLFGSESDSLKSKAESLNQKITVQKDIVKLNSEQQEKLTKKLSDQKTKQEELKAKIEAAKNAYKQSAEETGKNSEKSKALAAEIEKLEKDFSLNATAIGKTETALANQTAKTEKSKQALMNMEAELKNVNKQLEESKIDKLTDKLDSAGGKMENFGKKASFVSAGVAGVAAASIKSFTELDEGYDTIVTKTGATGEALEGLNQVADNIFGDMPTDMAIVGEAVGEVNTRFHSTGDELENTSRAFIQFAEINGTQVTQSVDQVDKIMQAWNVDVGDTGNLLGLLTSKAQETGISVDSLESLVLENNAAFKEMGFNLPQSIELLAQFDANGVDTAQAMTSLKKAVQNATKEGKPLNQALEETISGIKNASTETEAMEKATELFGRRGAAEMSKAIRENRIDLSSLCDSLDGYGSVVEDTYNSTLDPIDNAKVATNNMKLAMSQLATAGQVAAAPAMEKITGKIQDLTKWFTNLSPKQQDMIVKFGAVAMAVGPLAMGLGKVTKGISGTVKGTKEFVSGAAAFIGKIVAKTGATATAAGVEATATAATATHTAVTATATGVTGGMTAAQTALNTVMNLCPIVMIVALIGGLIAAGVALYKNWDEVKEKLSQLWGNIKEKFDKIKEKITGSFGKAKEAVHNKMKEMSESVKNNPIVQVAKEKFSKVKESVSDIMQKTNEVAKQKLDNMKNAYEQNGGGIKGVVAAGWEGLKGLHTAGFDVVDKLSNGKLSELKNKFHEKTDEIKSNWSEKWENLKETAKNKLEETKNNTSENLSNIKDKFHEKTSEIKDKWSDSFTNVKEKATSLMDQAKTNVKGKLDNIKNAYEQNGGGIKGITAAAYTGVKDYISTYMSVANKLTGGKLGEIKDAFSNKLNAARSTVSNIMDKIKSTFSDKIGNARDTVQSGINKIKSFFNFSWSLPHLKLPHFRVTGKFSLDPPSIPHFGVSWYKKGAVMNGPTIFGMNGNKFLAGGEPETGGEAILPLSEFYSKLDRILGKKLEIVANRAPVYVQCYTYLDKDEIASRTVTYVDEKMVSDRRRRR